MDKTECDNLLILFDIHSIENSKKIISLMFYLINFIDFSKYIYANSELDAGKYISKWDRDNIRLGNNRFSGNR